MPRHPEQMPHNRRRKGFQLLGPRHMAPVLMGAIVAAAILHYGGFRLLPWLFPDGLWSRVERPEPPQLPEERTLVRFQEEKSEPELSDEPEVSEPPEIETPLDEPQEIDLVDMPIEELTIAPGETNLALPTPEPASEAALQAPMSPDLQLAPLADSLPAAEPSLPEVAPVNANPLTVKAAALPDNLDPEKWLQDAIEKGKGEGDVPGDTRSLSELIQLANPGARDGAARLGADLIFSFNRAELKSSARISLLQLAALIHKNPSTRFIIEGHTDSIGSEAYNTLLSLQRAQAVRQWLKENGIPMKNVYIRPCGSRSPLVSTRGDREAQAANRRVEIHMRKSSEPLPEGCLDANYAVDMKTPISVQMQRGVKLPGSRESILQTNAPGTPNATQPAETKGTRQTRPGDSRAPQVTAPPSSDRPARPSRSFVPENIRPQPVPASPSASPPPAPSPPPQRATPPAPVPLPPLPAPEPVAVPVAEEVPEEPAVPASFPIPSNDAPRALEVPEDDAPVAGEVE